MFMYMYKLVTKLSHITINTKMNYRILNMSKTMQTIFTHALKGVFTFETYNLNNRVETSRR